MKAANKNHYNIVTSCDDAIIQYVAINITAISKNLENSNIDFFLLHSRISADEIEMLKALCNKLKNIIFHDIFVYNCNEYTRIAELGGKWPEEAYYPCCMNLLLPETVDRVLYLDAGDLLVLGDISSYYNYDFQDKTLIVTPSRVRVKFVGKDVRLTPFDAEDINSEYYITTILNGYFNSGSYVINVAKMREENKSVSDYVYLANSLADVTGKDKDVYLGDQGFFSAAFVGDVVYFAPAGLDNLSYAPYNFSVNWSVSKDGNIEKPDFIPAIIHFFGCKKPWKYEYPVFFERFQKDEDLCSLSELQPKEAKHYYTWYEYASITDEMLKSLGY